MSARLHPRLSLSAITTPGLTFEQDLDFWERAKLQCVGLFEPKIRMFGYDRAAAELKKRGLSISCIIAPPVTLLDRAGWKAEQARIIDCIDLARAVGGIVYGPTGKGVLDDWDGNARLYGEAVAPCVEHARACGVTYAFEPSLRPNLSFVHNLRDARLLTEHSGLPTVVDIGNCYFERDVREWIRKNMAWAALVQVSDVAIGTIVDPGAGVRTSPGRGELPLDTFVEAALAGGYEGPFEIEFMGLADNDEQDLLAGLRHMDAILRRLLG